LAELIGYSLENLSLGPVYNILSKRNSEKHLSFVLILTKL